MEIYNSFDEKKGNFIHTLVSDINTLKQELAKFNGTKVLKLLVIITYYHQKVILQLYFGE